MSESIRTSHHKTEEELSLLQQIDKGRSGTGFVAPSLNKMLEKHSKKAFQRIVSKKIDPDKPILLENQLKTLYNLKLDNK